VAKQKLIPLYSGHLAALVLILFQEGLVSGRVHQLLQLFGTGDVVEYCRGLYALAEWGYVPGVVRDVIKAVIDKNGPLSKEEVIDKVMKERYVKENTVAVNLQNPKYFKRDKENRYHVVGEKVGV